MESNYNKISLKVNELVELRLGKGTSPSELMENIESGDYVEVSAKKIFSGVQCTVVFFDNSIFNEIKIKYKYVYIYNKEMFLNEIKIIKDKIESTVWSRESEERNILEQIVKLFNNSKMDRYYKDKFIKSLPLDLYKILTNSQYNLFIG